MIVQTGWYLVSLPYTTILDWFVVEPGLQDCPKIGKNVSNLPELQITCPILNLKIGQADLILIILRIHTRLSFAKQSRKDFTMEGDMLRRFRANVFSLHGVGADCPNH